MKALNQIAILKYLTNYKSEKMYIFMFGNMYKIIIKI